MTRRITDWCMDRWKNLNILVLSSITYSLVPAVCLPANMNFIMPDSQSFFEYRYCGNMELIGCKGLKFFLLENVFIDLSKWETENSILLCSLPGTNEVQSSMQKSERKWDSTTIIRTLDYSVLVDRSACLINWNKVINWKCWVLLWRE